MSFEITIKEIIREVIREELAAHRPVAESSEYLSIDEAAKVAGVGKSTLRNWLKSGLVFSKIGTTVRIVRKDLDGFLKSKMKVSASELARKHYKG